MSDPIRVGVLGIGAISQIVHLPILRERSDVELLVLSDKDEHKARMLATRFEAGRVTDEDELLASDDVEAVFVCTPNHLHEAQAVAALEAGKHVLVERPLALTPEGARRVVEAAEAADRTVVVGMSHRWRPDVAALRSFVAGGELGTPYSGRCAWLNRGLPPARMTWRQKPEEAGGGALMDIGVQALDLLLWLVGYPEVRSVRALLHHGELEVEESAVLLMDAADGLALNVEVSWAFFSDEDRHHARVMGTDGSGALPPLEVHKGLGGRPMDVTPRQPRPRGDENPYMNAYRREIDHFIRTLSSQAAREVPTEQIALMELIEAAYRSAREGREVEL